MKLYLIILFTQLIFTTVHAQEKNEYLKEIAIRIEDPEKLSEGVYDALSPFKIIMVGEIHGINEAAQFVSGLTNLLTRKGDSVQVGIEIPSDQMRQFIDLRTDSSIYKSDFFANLVFESGKASFAWAALISQLEINPRIRVFFYDADIEEGKKYLRDSLMYMKIKTQYKQSPDWKMITLGGNYHNRTTSGTTMAAYIMQDGDFNFSSDICTLNLEYYQGTCRANFGKGLQVKELKSKKSIFNSTTPFDNYLFLAPSGSAYEYTGFYYSKFITAAKMTYKKQ